MRRSVSLVLAFVYLCTVTVQSPPADAAGSGQSQAAPRPNPDASGKYHVGDGVSPPKILHAGDPEYPASARRNGVSGRVVLSLTVDSRGKPQDVRVLPGQES